MGSIVVETVIGGKPWRFMGVVICWFCTCAWGYVVYVDTAGKYVGALAGGCWKFCGCWMLLFESNEYIGTGWALFHIVVGVPEGMKASCRRCWASDGAAVVVVIEFTCCIGCEYWFIEYIGTAGIEGCPDDGSAAGGGNWVAGKSLNQIKLQWNLLLWNPFSLGLTNF